MEERNGPRHRAAAAMNPNDPNVSLLELAAEQLGEALLEQLVFVGGAVARRTG
jgi:hypothetical protein